MVSINCFIERQPVELLAAAQSIAKYSWHRPGRVFAPLEAFYPIPQSKTMRPVPFMPYLNIAPSAWVLPLKFDGGGYRAGGKAMFDSAGNLWVGDNVWVMNNWQDIDSCFGTLLSAALPLPAVLIEG